MERNEIFYDWLRAKFFEIEDNDTRVQQLTAAVNDLATILEKDLHKVRCCTLSALDSDIPITNPSIVATYELVKKHWSSIEGKYPEPPRGILRGIILSALYQLGMKDAELCRIIYYTASGYCQFVRFGNEESIINRILKEFGKDVEDEALAEWSLGNAPVAPTPTALKLKNLSLELKLDSTEVDENELKKALTEAAGIEPRHNHGPQNGTQFWSPHFGSTASAGIVKAIKTAVNSFGGSLSTSTLETEINKYFANINNSLNNAFKESFQSLLAVERRSKLLWWKETLYSTTLRKSYREIDAAVLPVVMAIDLVKLLPDLTPVSVDYLLTDTYRAVKHDESIKQPLSKLLACFEDEEQQKLLASHLPMLTDCGERTTLTSFLTQVVHDQKSLKKLTHYTGLRADVEASHQQLAVIVLHDLLTERLIQEANAA
ncbi:hypothetical protein IC229_32760 [Spirosoma sp. BT702]|uniref:GTPase-associated system helical domain-containing protein n=1 Tax=Spirosoma profusum TaxID=2771354 RepID=A0A927GAH4_9BACT|nr:GTPase-associated system all-helical protein GASH [Spirosoma profusum]MBD2705428.1 hypothetical protein [Spirosoma profusum]